MALLVARGHPFDPCRAHVVECAVRSVDGSEDKLLVDDSPGKEFVEESEGRHVASAGGGE